MAPVITSNAHRARPPFVLLSLVVAAMASAACSDDTSPAIVGDASVDANPSPTGDAATSGDTSTGTTDSGTTTGDGGSASAACATASDCRLYSNSCGTCSCIPLNKDSTNPVCPDSPVSCIIDPCRDKAVGCVAGACVIE